MPKYMISFDDGWMDVPRDDLAEVSRAAHAVVDEAKAAGVWVFGGGFASQRSSVVATDGSVSDGPDPETKAIIGGFSIVEVPSQREALAWAVKFAAACRCRQEVRVIMDDPDL